jgi:hypothetical protein
MGKHCGRLGHAANWQIGHSGSDWLVGAAGHDRLLGRAGDDWLKGQAGRDWLFGGWDNDRLEGGAGHDWLLGGYGDDQLDGGPGNDRAYGGLGDDLFLYRPGDGSDVFHGGRGADVIRLDSVGDGWTLRLRRGEVLSDADGQLHLATGSAGSLRFADGGVLRFSGVERIETTEIEPTGVNQAPSILELSANTVIENVPDGTAVGILSATDPDPGDTLAYSLLDDAAGPQAPERPGRPPGARRRAHAL